MTAIEGKIAALLDKATVVINRGKFDGVSRDDEFYVYTELGPFIDPDTGEDLGTTRKVVGRIKVTILENRFSIAETNRAWRSSLAQDPLGGLFGQWVQTELPVAVEDLIEEWYDQVSVGTPVISVRRATQISSGGTAALLASVGEEIVDTDNFETSNLEQEQEIEAESINANE